MMAVHIIPATDNDGSPSLAYVLSSGRASALFAVIAGVGLALANGRRRPPTGLRLRAARWGVLARVPLLAVFGLILGDLDSGVAVILVNYALLFLLATFGLGWSPRRAFVVGAVWIVAVPIASHFLRPFLPEPSFDVPGISSLADPVRLLLELLLTGYYPVLPWLGYIWIGLGVGRLDLGHPRSAWRLAAVGVVLAVVSLALSELIVGDRLGDLPVQFFGVTPTADPLYLAVATPHSATPLDLGHTVGSSLLVIGLALLAARGMGWLAAAGGMTLTLYIVHVAALATGAGLGERVLLFWIHASLALLAGMTWLALFGRGPFERLLATTSALAREAAALRTEARDRPPEEEPDVS